MSRWPAIAIRHRAWKHMAGAGDGSAAETADVEVN